MKHDVHAPLLIPIMIECEGDTPLNDQVIIAPKVDPNHLVALIARLKRGTEKTMSLVMLCTLLKVPSKHSDRAITVIQQSCMSSYHASYMLLYIILYIYKSSVLKIINFKGVGIQVIKSCETSYL